MEEKRKYENVRYLGIPITELSREELMEALVELSEFHQRTMEEHRREINFIKNFRK